MNKPSQRLEMEAKSLYRRLKKGGENNEAYELVSNRPIIPYFDYDKQVKSVDSIQEHKLDVIDKISMILKNYYGEDITILIADASGMKKDKKTEKRNPFVSIHFRIRGAGYYKNCVDIQNIIENVLKPKLDEVKLELDTSVYTENNKIIRCVCSTKDGERKLVPIDSKGKPVKMNSSRYEPYLISYVEDEKEIETPAIVLKKSKNKPTTLLKEEVVVGLGIEEYKIASFEGGWRADIDGERICPVSGETHTGTNGLHIKFCAGEWTMKCFSERCEDERTFMTNEYDIKSNYTWTSFTKYIKKTIFESEEDARNYAIKNLPRVLAMINVGKESLVKKDNKNEPFSIINRSEFSTVCSGRNMKFKVVSTNNKGEEQIKVVSKSLMKYYDFIPEYDNIVVDPDNKEKGFNIWRGFKAKAVEGDEWRSDERLLLFERVFKDVYGELYDYVMDWFSFMVTNPAEMPGSALFVCGKQGSGKNMLFDTFAEYVIGTNLLATFSNIEEMTQHFNAYLAGKKLAMVNEASTTKEQYISNFNKMKNIITEKFISVEPKGKEKFDIKSILGCVIISNHEHAIHLEETDRRYVCIKTSDKYVEKNDENIALWSKVYKSIKSQEFGDIFYTMLLDRNAQRCNIEKIPMNAFKQELINKSKSNPIRFIEGIKEAMDSKEVKLDEDDDLWSVCQTIIDGRIKRSKIYYYYTEWCKDTGETYKFPKRKFTKEIESWCSKKNGSWGYSI